MTEENWSSEANEPAPKKKGLPKWLWFLGCGCLTMVLALAAGGFFLAKTVKTLGDPAVQWPALAEVLPIDEPYPKMTIIGMPMMSMAPGFDNMWTLADNNGRNSTVVYSLSGGDAREVRDGLLSEGQEIEVPIAGGVHDLVAGTISIQGRVLDCVRFTSFSKDEAEPLEESEGGFMDEMNKALRKSVIRVDVTPEGSRENLFVVIEYAKLGTLDGVADEEVAKFLAPFHIGPDR